MLQKYQRSVSATLQSQVCLDSNLGKTDMEVPRWNLMKLYERFNSYKHDLFDDRDYNWTTIEMRDESVTINSSATLKRRQKTRNDRGKPLL